jgi:putative transposase
VKRRYERHLPHEIPEGFPIFLTWNLKGALPAEIVARISSEKERLEKEPKRLAESARERKIRHAKLMFAFSDRYLDTAVNGPMELRDPVNAGIVENSIRFGVPERYELFAWCVMGNHVHVLLRPHWELAKIMQGIKGFTAREINKRQRRQGQEFWQDESYDHWARDDAEVIRIIDYIEKNPVVAGLCANPEQWRWSSARFRRNWEVGKAFTAELTLLE